MPFDVYSWVVIPLLIFMARIVDVSLGTLRFIFLAKGYKKLAPVLGFFEVLVWLIAIREVMGNLRNIACFLAYGAGFAMGNYIGLIIEEKLSIGMAMIRVVLRKNHDKLAEFMRRHNYGFTIVKGEGTRERVKILFSIVQRKNLPHIISGISRYNPKAFYTIENIRSVNNGVLPSSTSKTLYKGLFRKHRKSK